jgi:hypothetical protein
MLKDADQSAAVHAAAADLGYRVAADENAASGQDVLLRLTPDGDRPRPRPWGALRRAAGRVRARS